MSIQLTEPSTSASDLRALMTMASHDLKSPLAAVTAHVELIRADYGEALGEDFQRDLAAIERGLSRINRLAQDLLDYAKADHTLELTEVPLEEVVREAIADHLPHPDHARFTVNGALPSVAADASLLRHVVDNLIGNATKYSPADTTPTIEISTHAMAGGFIRIEVADRGIGIPPSDRPKVFDAFHRCRNSGGYPGTGLGLAICRRIVERHGGHIGVHDNPGGGSRFWFTLPASP
jgi:signal transduction histidine kinase